MKLCRYFSLLIFSSFIMISLTNCSSPNQPEVSVTGKLVVTLPSPANSKTLFGTGNAGGPASNSVVSYGLLLFDPSNTQPQHIRSVVAGTSIVSFDEITPYTNYSLLVLGFGFSAENMPGISSNAAYLIGSGEAKGISITLAHTTNVDITLYPVDLGGFYSDRLYLTGNMGNGNSSLSADYILFEFPEYKPGEYQSLHSFYFNSNFVGRFQNIPVNFGLNGQTSVTIPTGSTYLLIDPFGIRITEGGYTNLISSIWPSLPLPVGTSTAVDVADNSLGWFVGAHHFPVSTTIFTYPFDGSPVNLAGGNLVATVTWLENN